MKTNRNLGGLALKMLAPVAALALVLTGCSSADGGAEETGAADGEMTTLKVATIGLTSDGSILTGIEQGFFEEEGLNIELSIVANPAAGLAAAQSGQVDVAYAPSIPTLNALSQNVALEIIAPADGLPEGGVGADEARDYDDTGLYASADSGITSIADLEGKTISVPARNAQMEVVIANELEKAGIDPKTGVNWVVLDFTSAVAGLEAGTVDAAGLVSPFTAEAEEAGHTYLSSPSVAFFQEGAVGLWVAGTSTVDENSEAVAAFQRAVVKSNAYATEHPEEAVQAGLDYTESELPLEEVVIPVWTADVKEEDIERTNEQLVTLGFLPEAVDLTDVIVPVAP